MGKSSFKSSDLPAAGKLVLISLAHGPEHGICAYHTLFLVSPSSRPLTYGQFVSFFSRHALTEGCNTPDDQRPEAHLPSS